MPASMSSFAPLFAPSFVSLRRRGPRRPLRARACAPVARFWRNVRAGAVCPVTDTWQGTSGRKAATMATRPSRPRAREGPDTCAS